MCVAILVPIPDEGKQHVPLTLEELQACEKVNPAGGGIAFRTKKGIYFKKGISAEEIFELQKQATPPYQIHFRIPTIGGKDKQLCHPFPISKNADTRLEGYCKTSLIHNGHWRSWRDGMLCLLQGVMPSGPWSDTRAMSYLVAHHGPEILILVDEKVSLLNANGTYRFFGSGWHEHNGNWFSNLHWQGAMPKAPSQSLIVSSKTDEYQWARRVNHSSGDIEIDIFARDTKDADTIEEWCKWVGIKSAVVETALRKVRIVTLATEKQADIEIDRAAKTVSAEESIADILAKRNGGTLMLK